MLVDFMMIGAQKCGTTSLANQLAAHPEIAFCQTKEPGFFHQHEDWQEKLDEYHALYAPQPGQICGEASTMYTFLPEWRDTHRRLFAYNPKLKLIYIMRNPLTRILSNYSHNLVRGFVKKPAEVIVFEDATYINRSRYAVQIRPYLELFGADQLLLLLFEDYVADQQGVLQQIASFLDIQQEGFSQVGELHSHQSVGEYQLKNDTVRTLAQSSIARSLRSYIPATIRQPIRRQFSRKLDERPTFSPQLKQDLWRFLEDDIAQLELLMGRDLSQWRQELES